MKERPILFSAPMVRAILDGIKTRTRRIVPERVVDAYYDYDDWVRAVAGNMPHGRLWEQNFFMTKHRFGKPGDRLWVRETFCDMGLGCLEYRATVPFERGLKWTPSIFMPRWASRITLEVVSVRVERLWDISEADAIAEGVERLDGGVWKDYGASSSEHFHCFSARASFMTLWESINGPGSWDENPWVWVVEFKRVANG